MDTLQNEQLDARFFQLMGPGDLKVVEQNIDLSQLSRDEVVAKTIYSAISPGTEVAAYRGDPPLRPMKVYPRVNGYCNVAQVQQTGSGVTDYQTGDYILTFQSHRSAFVCDQTKVITKIPPDASLQEVSCSYLYNLGYDALLKSDVRPGLNIAVVGLGVLGLATVRLAHLSGCKVYAFSNQIDQYDLAKEFGATKVCPKSGETSENWFTELNQSGFDVVVTTSNLWSDWLLALKLPRKKGKICVLGFPGRGQQPPNFNPLASQFFYDKQLILIACGYTPDLTVLPEDIRFTIKRNCKFLVDWVAQGKLKADKLVSEVVPWHRLPEVYMRMMSREDKLLTCVLKWHED